MPVDPTRVLLPAMLVTSLASIVASRRWKSAISDQWFLCCTLALTAMVAASTGHSSSKHSPALEYRRSSIGGSTGGHVGEEWHCPGIVSAASPWPLWKVIGGSILGASGLLLLAPAVLSVLAWNTACEIINHAFGSYPFITEFAEGKDGDVTLVVPGTCTYAFWQAGMMQYICERFDTRRAKLAGVSSGALCAGLLLALEQAADNDKDGRSVAQQVRKRAQEIFTEVDCALAPYTQSPTSFVGRLGYAIDVIVGRVTPNDVSGAKDRVRLGIRRLVRAPLPALLPDVLCSFEKKEDLVSSILTSSHVGLVVRPLPVAYLGLNDSLCCDGVNPFSLYCVIEYFLQFRKGLTDRTAPSCTYSGLDAIYALWNCGAMRVLLCRRGSNLWLTPTLGGKLDLRNCLRVSGWFSADQWRQGYAHAHELDVQGYWDALPRRRAC